MTTYKKINNKKTILILLALIIATANNAGNAAKEIDNKYDILIIKKESNIKIIETKNIWFYKPYLQLGGVRFFHDQASNAAATADLFLPIWQLENTDLFFGDLRVNDRTGTPFAGNIHLGYRHLFPSNQEMYGVYGAVDRIKTEYGNYFSQLTIGGEYWNNKWFVGANFYKPVGDVTRDNTNGYYEKALTGGDAELGYEFTKGLVGYFGGYYFAADRVSTFYGPKARLAYDWYLNSENKVLRIFDKVGIEVGVKSD